MPDLTLINLPSIPKNIYSSCLAQKANSFDNFPKFFNKWEYIEKYCSKVVLKDKDFLEKLEQLVKTNIKFNGSSYIVKSSEFMQYEANRLASELLSKKYDEVLNIMNEATQIYVDGHEKFFDSKTINLLNSITAKCYKEPIHYEVFNLLLLLIDKFNNVESNSYEEEVKKALQYIYIVCDNNMMRIFENTALKYEDFCSIFIFNNKRISEFIDVKLLEKNDSSIRFNNLFEFYKNVRIYD